MGIKGADTWAACIQLFEGAGQLLVLVPEVPVPPSGQQLPHRIYDELLRRLAAVSPSSLRTALDGWPSCIYSSGPLMASICELLPSSIVESSAVMEASHGDEPQDVLVDSHSGSEQYAPIAVRSALTSQQVLLVEALALLHETESDCVAAARLLASIGSDMLFPFLTRHLACHAAAFRCSDVCRNFRLLFDLSPTEALALAVSHSSIFEPASVLDAIATCGRWWELHYLRLLRQHDPEAAHSLWALHLEVAAELEPHSLCILTNECVLNNVNITGDNDDDDDESKTRSTAATRWHILDSQLEAFQRRGSVDAELLLLQRQARPQEALRLRLQALGDVVGALRQVEAASGESYQQLWDCLLHVARGDSRTYSLLLVCLGSTHEPLAVAHGSQSCLVRALPSGFEVPWVALKSARALDDAKAYRDLHLLSLQRLQSATSSLSRRIYTKHRRGVAVAPSVTEDKPGTAHATRPARKVVQKGVAEAAEVLMQHRASWRHRALSLL